MDPKHFIIIAGRDVIDQLDAEKDERVGRGEDLPAVQVAQARRGYLGAQLVRSMYGWSVRYDSGLQNWDLLASTRQGTLDGSLKAAVEWAEDWAAQDPEHRYAWASRREVERDGFVPVEARS
jgi:hypothetical protein